jgi:hypothetical protein
MKTKLLLLNLLLSLFAIQMHAQDRTNIYTSNSEISDNLDLRAVASIFGDSKNLQDFERRLNDPKFQLSNLDLNNDNEVDYLRVIESVENRTHVIIIQAILDRDLYQDVATIDVEKDRYNKIHVQVVGDVYMYGQNYIYEPVYHTTPSIYVSFWASNYRPYCSSWYWNYYPSYYYAWNPYPVYRYRTNVYGCINTYNNYNYVNYRRSQNAIVLYNSRYSNGYAKRYPENSFYRRNSNVRNHYELDQRRFSKNEMGYSQNRNYSPRDSYQRKNEYKREYSYSNSNDSRKNMSQKVESQRDYSQRNNSQKRENYPNENTPQRTESQGNHSQNRGNSTRERISESHESQRDNSDRKNSDSRGNSGSSRGNNRRI